MFGSSNSIEPARAAVAGVDAAEGQYARALSKDGRYIREATPADRPEYFRPVRNADPADRAFVSAAADQARAKAASEGKPGFFQRRAAEPLKPDAVAQQHGLYTADKHGKRHYYADYQQKREVMWAGANSIKSKLDDKQTVSAMLDLAQSRGWSTVRLRGTADFQREAWVQAQVRGIAAEGYRPTATDQQEAARRTAAAGPVKAAEAKAADNAGKPQESGKVTNTVTRAAPAEKLRDAPVKAADAVQPKPADAAERTAAPTAASSKAAPAAVQAPTAAPAEKLQDAPAKAVEAGQPKPADAGKRTVAAPVQAVASKAASAAVQAPTAAASNNAAGAKVKAASAPRKNVWDAVEATGKQARASDVATAKATAGERPTSAATA